MLPRLSVNKSGRVFLLTIALWFVVISPAFAAAQTDDPLAPAMESARRKRDPVQLESLKSQLEQRISQNPKDASSQYKLALVDSYLVDVAESRKDKKAAIAALDKAIEADLRAIHLDDKSADPHSLLADLYGRKIGLGGGMLAGPRFGPKVGAENKRAMALDDKNPHVWASAGRQYLMAPKAFGGDPAKAIDSFKKSLALEPNQDETWVWLAKAYEKQSDKANAHDAIQHALQLNPQNPSAQETSKSLDK
jgi:cytochrome c-type biogenesis protein CcmH/NrfG